MQSDFFSAAADRQGMSDVDLLMKGKDRVLACITHIRRKSTERESRLTKDGQEFENPKLRRDQEVLDNINRESIAVA